MPVPIINSIQTADRKFETQTRPILIGCDDMNDYVCKYGAGNGFAKRLFCEYLAANFMQIWELPIPNHSLVNINPEHIPANFAIPNAYFTQTCFGLMYNRNYTELTKLNELNIASGFKNSPFKLNLLKIALFDCWLSNEDRNDNNYNLMFDLVNDYQLVAIDNEGIFNSRTFNNPIYSLNFNDSILNGGFAQKLFNKKDLTPDIIENLKTYFYLCAQNCEQSKNNILSNVPENWQIDTALVNEKLLEIFSDDWKNESFSTFQTFVQTLLNSL